MSSKKLTLKEMAERLNTTPKTLRKYVKEKNLPCLRIGRVYRFDAALVEEHLAFENVDIALPNATGGKKPVNIPQKTERTRFRKELGLS